MSRGLPAEFALVAACCRWPRSEARDEAVRHAAAGAVEWGRVDRVVARHRVPALVHDGLQQAGVVPPPDFARGLAQASAAAARTALAMARETLRLQAAFDEAGIAVLFVKGSAVAMLAYGELGIKQSWDIDLLTTPGEAAAARRLLERLGYALAIPANLDPAAFGRFVAVAKEAVFTNAALGTWVELHWRLVDNPRLLPGIDALSPSQDVALAGTSIRTLAPDALLAFLCVHGTEHAWARLKWLADVGALLSRQGFAGLERSHRAAVALGAGRAPGAALLLCQRLLGLALPEALADELRRDRWTLALASTAMASLTHGGAVKEIAPLSAPALRILASHFLIVGNRGFVWAELRLRWTSVKDRTELALPVRWTFAYHLLRIPLLLWRGLRQLWRPAA